MSIIKPMWFTFMTKYFPKFPNNLLSLNSKLEFHTCFPFNVRKNNIRIFKKNSDEKSVTFCKNPLQFGQIIALDPEKIEEYRDDTKPKLGKTNKYLRNKASLDNKEIGIKSSKDLKGQKFNKIYDNNDTKKEKINKNFNNNDTEKKSNEKKLKYKRLENINMLNSIMPNLKSRKHRQTYKEILLEGKRLINDALSSGIKAKMILFSDVSDLENLKLTDDVKVYKISYKDLQFWSCNTTCPGIMGVFELPELKITNENNSLLPVTVICDNIREPGNLGAILRVSAGVGCKKIILTKGCVDLWDPKVLRGGCGAHFKVSIFSNAEWSDIENEINKIEDVFIADNNCMINIQNKDENALKNNSDFGEINVSFDNNLPLKDYTSLDYKNSITFIVGGETHGISKNAYQFAINRNGKRIFIPMYNDIESLNSAVALGIILSETRKQMMILSNSDTLNNDSDCKLAEEVNVRAS